MSGMKRVGLSRMIAAGFLLAWGAAAQAAMEDDGRSLEASATATVITADKLTFDYLKKFAQFENNVVVNDPRLQLRANKLTIIFTEAGGAQTILLDEPTAGMSRSESDQAIALIRDVISMA